MSRVLLTGAFGNVGANTLRHLCDQGHELFAFDRPDEKSEQRAADLGAAYEFTALWGDLRSAEEVRDAVQRAVPEAILHAAAVIPPIAYRQPELAYDVNVNGTRYLLEAAAQIVPPPHFIFVSSYSVHGPRNPHRNLPPLTGESPVNPADNYARHKVAGEEMVRESPLPWTILRLPAVLATDPDWGTDPDFLKLSFLLPLERREHLLDSRDAGLALANAVRTPGVRGRTLNLGGAAADCQVTAREFMGRVMEARGLRLPENAFRAADPDVDESWYYEDWVDPSESEALLQYQQHSFEDYLKLVRDQMGWRRHFMRLISPLVSRRVAGLSPFPAPTPLPDPRSHWEVACEIFAIDPDEP